MAVTATRLIAHLFGYHTRACRGSLACKPQSGQPYREVRWL